MRINHGSEFSCQVQQFLVKVECDFSWRAQHVVTSWEIAGARNVIIFPYKMQREDGTSQVSEAAGAR